MMLDAKWKGAAQAFCNEIRACTSLLLTKPGGQRALSLYGTAGFGDHYSDHANRLDTAIHHLQRAKAMLDEAEKLREQFVFVFTPGIYIARWSDFGFAVATADSVTELHDAIDEFGDPHTATYKRIEKISFELDRKDDDDDLVGTMGQMVLGHLYQGKWETIDMTGI